MRRADGSRTLFNDSLLGILAGFVATQAALGVVEWLGTIDLLHVADVGRNHRGAADRIRDRRDHRVGGQARRQACRPAATTAG
jgi:hypothetical protein